MRITWRGILGIKEGEPLLRLPEDFWKKHLGWQGAFFVLLSFVTVAAFFSWQLGFVEWGFGPRVQNNISSEKGLRFSSPFFSFDGLEVGQRVLACVPSVEWGAWAKDRGYLGFGACPGRSSTLEKVVVAKPGDRVRVREEGVWVNGSRIRHSERLGQDSAGASIRAIPEGEYLVGPDEVWTMNPMERSFDSRYYGPVPSHLVHGLSLALIPRLPPRVDVVEDETASSRLGGGDAP